MARRSGCLIQAHGKSSSTSTLFLPPPSFQRIGRIFVDFTSNGELTGRLVVRSLHHDCWYCIHTDGASMTATAEKLATIRPSRLILHPTTSFDVVAGSRPHPHHHDRSITVWGSFGTVDGSTTIQCCSSCSRLQPHPPDGTFKRREFGFGLRKPEGPFVIA
ncbi:hypothetical protein BDN72DRAFT_626113 [Pluteus cervinus]|uniref:Uncharacterized protein n=1 Tax=Pluteus cervinus TaxID=181527 RepID=A0ACD3ATQ5_9AGAR|nr:hypothetical protein BDN72DRAFT_626113 [Pluteus cervinus]